jgi:uncharacterized protein
MISSRTALITGASSGIGLEIARALAAMGCDLVLVARRQRRLTEIADQLQSQFGIQAVAIAQDLSAIGASNDIHQQLRERQIDVDILVNNAGLGIRGAFAEADVDEILNLLQVNITAVTHLTRLLLPPMLQRRSGRILNISSLCAPVPGPYTAIYNASKAYVQSLSEALAHEVTGSGVTVTALCPGPTESCFAARAGMSNTLAFSGGVMDSAAVALVAIDAMERGKTVAVAGFRNQLRMLSIRWTPRRLLAYFSAKYHRPLVEPSAGAAASRDRELEAISESYPLTGK